VLDSGEVTALVAALRTERDRAIVEAMLLAGCAAAKHSASGGPPLARPVRPSPPSCLTRLRGHGRTVFSAPRPDVVRRGSSWSRQPIVGAERTFLRGAHVR
jgi:hypothetical protein